MNRSRHTPGFSLVETLIALVLFILAIGVLAEAANNALLAINLMEVKEGNENNFAFVREAVLTLSDTELLQAGGQVMTPSAGNAIWSAESETTNTPDLFAITLSVTLAGDEDQSLPPESANETIYAERPLWSDADDRSASLSSWHDALQAARTTRPWP